MTLDIINVSDRVYDVYGQSLGKPPLADLYRKYPMLKRVDRYVGDSVHNGLTVFERHSMLPILNSMSYEPQQYLAEIVYDVVGHTVTVLEDEIDIYSTGGDMTHAIIPYLNDVGEKEELVYITYYPEVRAYLISNNSKAIFGAH